MDEIRIVFVQEARDQIAALEDGLMSIRTSSSLSMSVDHFRTVANSQRRSWVMSTKGVSSWRVVLTNASVCAKRSTAAAS